PAIRSAMAAQIQGNDSRPRDLVPKARRGLVGARVHPKAVHEHNGGIAGRAEDARKEMLAVPHEEVLFLVRVLALRDYGCRCGAFVYVDGPVDQCKRQRRISGDERHDADPSDPQYLFHRRTSSDCMLRTGDPGGVAIDWAGASTPAA